MTRVVRLYGSSPRHLVATLTALAAAAYAWTRIVQHGQAEQAIIWFLGAILAHDLVLFPLYRLAYEIASRAGRVGEHPQTRVPILRHVVVPAVISAILLITWIPLILQPGRSATTYRAITGVSSDPFLARWVLITVGLFAVSALIYAARTRLRWSRPHR
jgi:hypothetical protein